MKRTITLSCDDDSLFPNPLSQTAESLAQGIGFAVLGALCDGISQLPDDVRMTLLSRYHIEVETTGKAQAH